MAFEDPFDITLDWKAEAEEYPGDSNDSVELTMASLDGEDVLADAVKQDDNTYIVTVDEIALGEHTLRYNAMDTAGNTNANPRSLTFTVGEAPTWKLRLRKGMNLISLPSNPMNGDIDVVFAGASQVDLVFTFEGNQALVAVANPGTGGFGGTLETIDSQHAYWVSASNAVTVEIDIPATSQRTVLPSIRVKGGEWNLVPVLSLGRVSDMTAGRGAKAGTEIDADAYLGDFQTAFGWDRGRWVRVDPDPTGAGNEDRLTNDIEGDDDTDDPVLVGKGYWVLYAEDAFIVPR
jgi:hypothetical protein